MQKSKIKNPEEPKTCKKCGRKLPTSCKANLCESCQADNIGNIKKIGVAVAGFAATAGGIALAIVKNVAKR